MTQNSCQEKNAISDKITFLSFMTVIYRSSFLIYNKREDYKAFLSNKKGGGMDGPGNSLKEEGGVLQPIHRIDLLNYS